jgi:hypothetical protein
MIIVTLTSGLPKRMQNKNNEEEEEEEEADGMNTL